MRDAILHGRDKAFRISWFVRNSPGQHSELTRSVSVTAEPGIVGCSSGLAYVRSYYGKIYTLVTRLRLSSALV